MFYSVCILHYILNKRDMCKSVRIWNTSIIVLFKNLIPRNVFVLDWWNKIWNFYSIWLKVFKTSIRLSTKIISSALQCNKDHVESPQFFFLDHVPYIARVKLSAQHAALIIWYPSKFGTHFKHHEEMKTWMNPKRNYNEDLTYSAKEI